MHHQADLPLDTASRRGVHPDSHASSSASRSGHEHGAGDDRLLIVEDEPGVSTLVARVAREAITRIGLAPGLSVRAIIKPEAIDHRVLG